MTTAGLRKIVTGYGLSPGTLPTASLEHSGSTKLRLGLGFTTLQIGLGDDPLGAVEALRDALSAALEESETRP